MTSVDRRLDKLEEKLKSARTTPWWRNPMILETVADIMAAPVKPSDASAWTPETIAASRWRQIFTAAFGTPVWLDNAWRWPEHRGSNGGVVVVELPRPV